MRPGARLSQAYADFQIIAGEVRRGPEGPRGIKRKGEWIRGVVTAGLQRLLPAETVDKMGTAVETLAWRFPFKKPDDLRHPTSQAVRLPGRRGAKQTPS